MVSLLSNSTSCFLSNDRLSCLNYDMYDTSHELLKEPRSGIAKKDNSWLQIVSHLIELCSRFKRKRGLRAAWGLQMSLVPV